jgi:hypothetical protein
MKQTFRRSVARCGLLFVAVLFCMLTSPAQQTLGSLNGTVVDPSGAAVVGATVSATNAAINVTRTTTTQGNGFYQIFNLPIGDYVVTVKHEGFEATETKGIAVQEARATTVNATLKLGKTTESVEVTANPLLNSTDATNGYTLDSAQIEITPLATGSFTQLAVLSPGVNAELLANLDSNAGIGNQPIWANGQRDTSNTFQVNGVDATNLFNGKSSSGSNSQRYNFNTGGGSTSSTSAAGSSYVGGASPVGTSVYDSIGNSLPSPPPEFLQELRVNASMYDAQQGATSGAQIDANTATGTNKWHGQAYGSFANNWLNAAPFFFSQQYQLSTQGVGALPASMANPALHRWTTGGSVGGPVLKNKVFIFLAYQHRYNSDAATGMSQMTVPSGLTSDRSEAGLLAAGQSWNNGKALSGTLDPIAESLLQATLPDGSLLVPSAQSTAPVQFGVPNVTLLGTSILTADQATASVDFDVSKSDRFSFKYYYQNDPVSKPFGYSQTGGFPVGQNNGSQVGAIDNTIAIGSRLNWEQRLGYDRMGSYAFYHQTLTGGAGGDPQYGIGTGLQGYNQGELPGLLIKDFGVDSLSSGQPGLKVGPYSSFVNMGFQQNRLNPSTNVIFALGKHTIVAGGGYSYTQLNIDNNRSGLAQVESSNFGDFLMDYKKTHNVSSANVLESIDPVSGRNNADRYYRSNEISSYAQDKWQAQSNLSITAGVRYDYHGGMSEKYGNMFNFEPSLYSVTGTSMTGFTVNNAGFVVAGNNKYDATPGVSNSTLDGRQWGISPRLGFAWSPKMNRGAVVFRGGAGIYFDRGELFTYLSQPAGSGNGGPFGVTESAPLASFVQAEESVNKSTLANPLGSAFSSSSYIAPSSNPATINQALQNQLNIMTGDSSDGYGKNCGGVDSQEGYLDCTPTLNFGAYDKNNVLPYTINYTLNMQWQPTNDLALTIGYTGNRGRHAVIPVPFNEAQIATPSNPIWGETSTYGFEVLNQNSTSDGYDYDPIATEPWNTATGGNTDFRAPYVGYNSNAALWETVGNSAYDALETHLEKRLSHNFQVGASYTWSHSLDEQSDIGLFFTGDNPNDLRDSWASSDFDRTNVFSANFLVNSPKLAKDHSAASYVLNDWHLTGIAVLQSGEPYSLYEFYGAVGSVNVGNYPNLMNPVLGIKDPTNPKTALTGNKGPFRGSGGSYMPAIDPNQIAIKYVAPGEDGVPSASSPGAVAGQPVDIYETDFVHGQRNIFRQAAQKRADISIRKTIALSERIGLQYELNIFNLTNTASLDVPMDQGQIRQNSACSASATQYAIDNGYNCAPGTYYYVNYGQIVTSGLGGPGGVDQQSAKANLDQVPYTTGSGRSLQVPTLTPLNTGTCVAVYSVAGGCPNNSANFGSVLGTIGGSRAFTTGMHITF